VKFGGFVCWAAGVSCGSFVVERGDVFRGVVAICGNCLWVLWVYVVVDSENVKLLGLAIF